MALKLKKGGNSSFSDVISDLLGDSDEPPVKGRSPAWGGGPGRAGVLPSRSGKRSLLDDDFFSKLAEEAGDEEVSDVSEADPLALLESLKDMDDMEADLLSRKKPSSAPSQTSAKASGGRGPKGTQDTPPGPGDRPGGQGAGGGPGEDSMAEVRKPSSAPPAPATRSYKKFSFTDVDDPLADFLDDLDERKDSKPGPLERKPSPPETPSAREQETGLPKRQPLPQKKREDLTFDDDGDELMEALGFAESRGEGQDRSSEPPVPARTRLDEILGRGTAPRLLERPLTGERKELQPEKSAGPKDPGLGEDDFTFGAYQPTMASTPEGRQSRRQSVRFSTEDVSGLSPDRRSKPSTLATTPGSARAGKTAADWLGLKQEEEEPEEEPFPTPPSPSPGIKPPASRPPSGVKTTDLPAPAPSHSSSAAKASQSASRPGVSITQEEEEDWLAGALTRKRSQGAAREERKEEKSSAQQEHLGLGEEVDLDSFLSKRSPSPAARRRAADTVDPSKEPSSPLPLETPRQQAMPPQPGGRGREEKPTAVTAQRPVESSTPPPQPQAPLSADSLQQLLLQSQLAQSQLWGRGGAVDLAALQRPPRGSEQLAGEEAVQNRIAQLEGQVRKLQLELGQAQMLLESMQQRHRQDTDLMESTHRARVQLLEEAAVQREGCLRHESEELQERVASLVRLGEQERAELQAQYQRRLAQAQQERDREVERLRDLQRKAILEMKREHEEQLARLKRLKDEEVDAVTSATSQTRSLAGAIEQMEQFSWRLGELASRVESSHEHSTQGLEQGARQRDQQLRVLQDRLEQQQKDTEGERSRLQEVIARMEARLSEQQRQLEKERWRVSAEQAKAEASHRALEEERRTLTQNIAMEREELQRAKSALLEEQQAVMTRCAEERRRLAAEWAELHAQDKLRQERTERESSRALERDAHREGTIISLAQEQAELKLRGAELRLREEALVRAEEAQRKEREELQREKEQLSGAALRLRTRAEEVEAYSKLAAERYEEGDRALREARQVASEQQGRLSAIQQQRDALRQQEQHLHQQRVKLTDSRRQLQQLTQALPLGATPVLAGFAPQFTSTQLLPPLELPHAPPVPDTSSSELQARLALLRHTAEKDRDYLQDEQFFLETLKKAPYNMFHTA
ncbi:fas-binding factor 1 homolog [Amia ocellicauda]|uniref:fas-binding factor 1 homolog n=1 Tax=Amia ocellicauda TaxID=2972642 RepID=UPI00346391AC